MAVDGSGVNLAAFEAAGQAMTDAGYSVTAVTQALTEIATVNGFPRTQAVVFPTALFVSTRGSGEVRTGAVTSGRSKLTLLQADELDEVITAARSAPMAALELSTRIAAVRALPPPYTKIQRILGYAAASTGISVLLGTSLPGLAVAVVLGALVGFALTRTEHVPQQYQALVTAGCSFVVALAVLLLVRLGVDPGVLPSMIAPLVVFLPGALLTTGVVELFTGHMMAGAGRVAAGAMQLMLLAAGVLGAAALVGIPALELTEASQPIGPLGPWLAVAVFGVGIVVHSNGRLRSIGWILLVLYVAYGAQVLADIFVGGVLSAFVGALAMTPVAALVAGQPSGPSAFVSFLPAFWMLVPGALGLVGVATMLEGNTSGQETLITTASTMVAIALGTLAGSALADTVAPTKRALI
jgi:uncharacterized membrane protein YjjP (DUF1212 family)/uncharacterized membrane protein YjjB (DUF3815 family)